MTRKPDHVETLDYYTATLHTLGLRPVSPLRHAMAEQEQRMRSAYLHAMRLRLPRRRHGRRA
jgi:hypothetical protein